MVGFGLTDVGSAPLLVDRLSGLLIGVIIQVSNAPLEAGLAGIDEVLDAVVVAWTAHRIAIAAAESFPASPVVGPDGLTTAIWY